MAALRLREKGYSVGVLECGRRCYEDPQWTGLAAWEAALAPHYDEDDPADLPERMVVDVRPVARATTRTATRPPPRWPSTR